MTRRTANGIARTTKGIVATTEFTAGLDHWWKIDEGSGSTAKDYEGTNDGTISGATWTTDAKTGGYALDFDGTDDEVDTGNPYAPGGESYTTTQWVKVGSFTDDQVNNFIDTGTRSVAGVDARSSDSSIRYFVENKNTNAVTVRTGTLSTGTWYHIATVYDDPNNVIKIFRDGSQVDSATAKSIISGTDAFWIGSGGGFSYIDAIIDDVRIYEGDALSSSDISIIYNNTK